MAEAKEWETLPPFHPNCKCTIRAFSTKNPNHDPWLGETVFWLEIIYGDGTLEQKAQKLIDFYHWKEFSVELIAKILSFTRHISHIEKRMAAFLGNLQTIDEYVTVNTWLNLHNRPTVPTEGRIVEMSNVKGWNPYNWYAFEGNPKAYRYEGRPNINEWARTYIEGLGKTVVADLGEKEELFDAEGRYWIAVGPNVMKPDHEPLTKISLEEMKYGAKVDVVLRHDDGTIYYLPAVIGDCKAHTYPNGILQTGINIETGEGTPVNKPGEPIEFIGAELPKGLIDFEIVHIIVYE